MHLRGIAKDLKLKISAAKDVPRSFDFKTIRNSKSKQLFKLRQGIFCLLGRSCLYKNLSSICLCLEFYVDFVSGKANFCSNNLFIARKFNVAWRKIRQNDKCNEIQDRF